MKWDENKQILLASVLVIKLIALLPPPQGIRPEEAKSRGGTTSSSRVYSKKYLQFNNTVSMPRKISICLNRSRMESLGNDDVSIVCARK